MSLLIFYIAAITLLSLIVSINISTNAQTWISASQCCIEQEFEIHTQVLNEHDAKIFVKLIYTNKTPDDALISFVSIPFSFPFEVTVISVDTSDKGPTSILVERNVTRPITISGMPAKSNATFTVKVLFSSSDNPHERSVMLVPNDSFIIEVDLQAKDMIQRHSDKFLLKSFVDIDEFIRTAQKQEQLSLRTFRTIYSIPETTNFSFYKLSINASPSPDQVYSLAGNSNLVWVSYQPTEVQYRYDFNWDHLITTVIFPIIIGSISLTALWKFILSRKRKEQ